MNVIEGTLDFHLSPSQVIIGKFDGFHLGHKQLLDAFSAGNDLPTVMVTFDFSIAKQTSFCGEPTLFTHKERIRIAEWFGIDTIVFLPFTEELRTMEPECFIRTILLRQCNAKELSVGEDFHFGKDRAGDAALLRQICEEEQIQCHVVPVFAWRNEKISSTRLRDAMHAGYFANLLSMLGYPYFVLGDVVHGKKIGHRMGFPTLNLLPPKEKLLPAFGVYASIVLIDGKRYQGITNVGDNPTVADGVEHDITVETHVLDYDADAYGKECIIFITEPMRSQQVFGSLEELTEQLARDKAKRCEMPDFSDIALENIFEKGIYN